MTSHGASQGAGVSNGIRTTRTRCDVSHTLDSRPTPPVKEQLPPSKVPRADYVEEIGVLASAVARVLNAGEARELAKEQREMLAAQFTEDELSPFRKVVFPSSIPSSREDAAHLDAWTRKRLGELSPKTATEALAAISPILATSLHELARQLWIASPSRGATLLLLWSTYSEIFEALVAACAESVKLEQGYVERVAAAVRRCEQRVKTLQQEHPVHMHNAVQAAEERKAAEIREIEQKVERERLKCDVINAKIGALRVQADAWFPHVANAPAQSRSLMARRVESVEAPGAEPPVEGDAPPLSVPRTAGGPTTEEAEVVRAVGEDMARIIRSLTIHDRMQVGVALRDLAAQIAKERAAESEEKTA